MPATLPRKSLRLGRTLTGLGLFSMTEIRKNARIARYTGRLLPTKLAEKVEARGNRYLFEINSRWTIDGTPRSNFARYANHSCNPNAEAYYREKSIYLRALRRIRPGEEITYHYGMDYLRNVIGISNCKCGRCRRRKAKKARARRKRIKMKSARKKRQRGR